MIYRNIPNIDTKISVLCFGTGNVDFEHEKENQTMMDLFLEQGGNFFDTANIYGKWLDSHSNESEIILGDWMDRKIRNDKSVRRSDLVISSKGGHPRLETMNTPRMTYNELQNDLEESLHALKTDYIDIYWLHRDAENLCVGEILEPLLRFKQEGKIRLFGLSNWTADRILEAEKYLESIGLGNSKENEIQNIQNDIIKVLNGLFGIQNRWSAATMNPEGTEDATLVAMSEQEYDWHIKTGIAAMPYSGMAKGYFTKFQKLGKEALNHKLLDYYDNPLNDSRMAALAKISRETGLPVSRLVLAFLWNQPFPVFPIVRFADRGQLMDCVEASSIVLTDVQMIQIASGVSF